MYGRGVGNYNRSSVVASWSPRKSTRLRMNPPLPKRELATRRAENAATVVLCLLALVLRALSHAPGFDEAMHVRFAWLPRNLSSRQKVVHTFESRRRAGCFGTGARGIR